MENNQLIYRIIDANLNRLKEGIRVVEDIYRFYFNDKDISLNLKKIRHLCRVCDYMKSVEQRDIINDPLKSSTKSENSRTDINDILISNFKRAQESARVLEEILKLISIDEASKFKNIRYELYNIEKICLVNKV
jgi:thiamine-phosphate pyrophosphorylase